MHKALQPSIVELDMTSPKLCQRWLMPEFLPAASLGGGWWTIQLIASKQYCHSFGKERAEEKLVSLLQYCLGFLPQFEGSRAVLVAQLRPVACGCRLADSKTVWRGRQAGICRYHRPK